MSGSSSDSSTASASCVELIPGGPVVGSIRPPGSKSLTNRALICAAMAQGSSTLRGALASEDTEVMIGALNSIGIAIASAEGGRTLAVPGSCDSIATSAAKELFIANSGTTIRFLTAVLSAHGGHYRLHGVERMHQRPIGDLVDALSDVVNGDVTAESDGGCPPVLINSKGWSGSTIKVAGSVSSQFLSGLMMAAPINSSTPAVPGQTDARTAIHVQGELVSRPYVEMTAEVMRSFGAVVDLVDDEGNAEKPLTVLIRPSGYQGTDYDIEPDASAASYFWAAAAISGGKVKVEGLTPNAMQGDVGFCNVLEKMGCVLESDSQGMTITGGPLRGIDVDMNAISDTVQTLSVVALFAHGPTRVRGVAHNRYKETDRIGDLACELRKLGAQIDEHEDGLTIHPPTTLQPATLETYHDHRMAMSLSLAGLRQPGVRILNPACTSKTYPEYFADVERLTGRAHRWSS